MTSEIERALSELGLNLGQIGEPLEPVRSFLAGLGIQVRDETLWKWRKGGLRGEETATIIGSIEVIRRQSSEGKLNFYSQLTQIGLSLRRPQQRLTHRYVSEGFTEEIAGALGKNSQDMREAVRALRASIVVSSSQGEIDENLLFMFKEVANEYFKAYTDPDLNYPSQIVGEVEELKQEWDGTSIRDFYGIFYGIFGDSPRAIGALLPYELPFMREYVETLGGNLTTFDLKVLRACAEQESSDDLAQAVKRETGVPLDRGPVGVHRRILISRF